MKDDATHGDIMQGIGAIEADVRWIRDSLERGHDKFDEQGDRLKSLEKSRTSTRAVGGVLAAAASFIGLTRLHDWLSN